MRIAITGSSGFIGRHLIKQLVSDKNELLLLDSNPVHDYVNVDGVQQISRDICDPVLQDDLSTFKPEVVIHLAAQKDVRFSIQYPEIDFRINTEGSRNVFESAFKSGSEHVIYASSGGAIYSESNPLPISEVSTILPKSPYGKHKYEAELALYDLANKYGRTGTALRMSNAYGPGDKLGVAGIFVRKALAKELITIVGDGTLTRDFIFVSDVVDAFILDIQHRVNLPLNISSATEISLNELVKSIEKVSGFSIACEYRDSINGEIQRSSLDNSLAKQQLNWEPQICMDQGIRELIDTLISENSEAPQ